MQREFLCPKHARTFVDNPELANRRWGACVQKGLDYYQQNQYQRALMFMGTGFDIADLLVQHQLRADSNRLSVYEQLIIAGHGLAECYQHLGDTERERYYLQQTHGKLMHAYREKAHHRAQVREMEKPIEISLMMIKRHFDRCGEYMEIQDKHQKDMQCLQHMHLMTFH